MGREEHLEDQSLSWLFFFWGSIACWVEAAVGFSLRVGREAPPFLAPIWPGGWLVVPLLLFLLVGFSGFPFYLYELYRKRLRPADHAWLVVFVASFCLFSFAVAWV